MISFEGEDRETVNGTSGEAHMVKLWMLTEISGEPGEAVALVWAEDPGEAQWLLREKTGKKARVCTEIQPEKGVAALIGIGAAQ
jgi:hypothetical protein